RKRHPLPGTPERQLTPAKLAQPYLKRPVCRPSDERLEPETPERAASESCRHSHRSCPTDQGQSGCSRQQVVAYLDGSPLSTINRVDATSESSIKYPHGVIGKRRESRLPVDRKSGSRKLESGKKSVKKASNLSKK
ncbi:hypothetical protein, partial [Marinospirillum sp.]|uniref:hypothetical protein n=1 Tax=Marinospirillum sp. TaxID=2183934 RepID=UPI0025C68924